MHHTPNSLPLVEGPTSTSNLLPATAASPRVNQSSDGPLSRARLSRRRVLSTSAAGVGLATLGLTGCSTPPASTSQLVHGATGGSLKDSLDPHFPVTVPDIARVRQLYEPLLRFDPQYRVQTGLAEHYEHNSDATEWTFRLRDGIQFHNGKTVTSSDIQASLARMMDPKNPAPFLSTIVPIVDLANSKKLDARTFRLKLKQPYVVLDQLMASYTLGIIPADFDIAHPVGTGPFKFSSFVPGQRSVFTRFDDYWEHKASFETLTIIDFADDAAKVNALLADQVQTIDNLPAYLAGAIERQGSRTLVSETGGWVPFTMRVDLKPFSDVRVRQALRLIADRQQLIDQALSGFGRLGNDLYAPFDPDYLGNQLPQRHQDIGQAKSLLKQAGYPNLQIELVTSSAVGAGGVESANLFVSQAKAAGVQVRLRNVDGSIFYGNQYLAWGFAQDFWDTRTYLPQVAACALKTSPYNETHFNDPTFTDLVTKARGETDAARRRTLLQDAQQIEFDRGGYIIWAFKNQVDAYNSSITGLTPTREAPLSSYRFNLVKPASAS